MAVVREWHRQSGFGYPLPNLLSPLAVVRGVAERDGKIVAAGIVRLIGEEYLLLNPDSSPTTRARAALELQAGLELDAKQFHGLDSISAWIPPEIEGEFAEKIVRLGWIKSPWQNYTRFL